MKRIFYKGMLTVFLLLYGSVLWANGTLQYSISKEKFEDAWVVDTKDGFYSVVIKLKEPYKEEFAKLTAINIGKRLQILFEGQILVEAIIKDEIDSGIISDSGWKSEEDALKFIDTLLNRNPSEKAPQ